MCQFFMSGEEEAAMKVVWCSRARACNDVLICGAAACCGALLRSWRLCLLQEEPEQEASCFSLSPGFLCASKLRLHQRRQPVRQRPAENHDPEGAGAALLPVRTHHHLPHPGGPGDR